MPLRLDFEFGLKPRRCISFDPKRVLLYTLTNSLTKTKKFMTYKTMVIFFKICSRIYSLLDAKMYQDATVISNSLTL